MEEEEFTRLANLQVGVYLPFKFASWRVLGTIVGKFANEEEEEDLFDRLSIIQGGLAEHQSYIHIYIHVYIMISAIYTSIYMYILSPALYTHLYTCIYYVYYV